uniref:Thionin-like protein n=1 Tax=Glycine max TaxID=3847 RepID=A0A368UJZ8_SOYBN|eukprot:XP_014629775.1 uncharacterized protein LOC106798315 [Glycine max]
MSKNEMKLPGVVIMVMLVIGFAEADFNSTFVQIESNRVSSKPRLTCGPKCELSCLPYVLAFILYPICVAACMKQCRQTPIDTIYSCLSGCDAVKSLPDNNEGRGRAAYVVDSCLDQCEDKK